MSSISQTDLATNHVSTQPQASRVGRRVRIAAIFLTAVALLFVLGLSVFNSARAEYLHAHNPVRGSFYEIEGRLMYLDCLGSGSPTILLEAGSGDDTLYWQTIQPQLARVTRVCSYDRAGIGWSEPQTGPRDAEAIARQLHELLDRAAVPRPLVMAGASAGGYYVREYARAFPGEVAGVALLDASSPQQIDELPGSRAWYDAGRRTRPSETFWLKVRTAIGWERLMGRCRADPPPSGLDSLAGAMEAEMCRPGYVGGDLGEWMDFETAGHQAARLTSFGPVPLLVMSQDPDRPKTGWTADAIAAQPIWNREQEALKSLSPKSWRVIARGSPHHIHGARPELVVGEMTRLIDYLRGGATPPFGATAVE